MAYSFDEKKYTQIFDQMFGKGAYDSGMSQAGDIGRQIGDLKKQARIREEQQRELEKQQKIMEAAQKEAAKQERERQKKVAEKKAGKSTSKIGKENENTKFRIEKSGGSTKPERSWIENALNLKTDAPWYQDALDLMYRPINALMNPAKEQMALNKKNLDLLNAGKISDAEFSKRLKNNGYTSDQYVKSAVKGLTGKERTTGSDMLMAAGGKPGMKTAVAGAVLDMNIDPLNAITGVGQLLGAGKLIGAGAKAARELPGIKQVANVAGEALSRKSALTRDLTGNKIDDSLFKNVNKTEYDRLSNIENVKDSVARAMNVAGKDRGHTVGKGLESALIHQQPLDIATAPSVLNPATALDLMNPLKSSRAADSVRGIDTLGKITTKTVDKGIDVGPNSTWGTRLFNVSANAEEKATQLIHAGDTKKAAEALRYSPKINKAVGIIQNSNKSIRDFAESNGITIPDMQGYMAHFVTEEAAKNLKKSGEVVSNGMGRVGGNDNAIARTLKMSTENANRTLKKQKGVNFDHFTGDAFIATAAGQQKFANYIAKETVKNHIINNPSVSRVLKNGAKPRAGNVAREIDGKTYELTRGANAELENYAKLNDEVTMKRFWKAYDYVQAKFKTGALFSVGNHERNLAGNNLNMFLAGMEAHDLAYYQTKAFTALDGIKARRVSGEATKKVDQIYDEYVKQGLKDTGSTADLVTDAGKNVMSDVRFRTKGIIDKTGGKLLHEIVDPLAHEQGALNKIKGVLKSPFEASKKLASASDEMSRFALFMWAKDKGMSAEKAADKVREVLFDYNDLTKFEKGTAKRLMPFYTWMRKNAEFQLKSLAKTPDRHNKLNTIFQNASDNYDHPLDILPDYMKENMTLPIPGGDKLLALNPPMATLNQLSDPAKMAVDSLSPLVKLFPELYFNKKTLNGAPIQKFKGEKDKVLGFDLPVKEAYALKNLIAPARNMTTAMAQQEAGSTAMDGIKTMLGANTTKNWDQEGFQNQADYKEKNRLGDILQQMKADGKEVQTVKDLRKQGVYQDPAEAKLADTATKAGLSQQDADMLVALRKKVYNNNAEYAAKIEDTLSRLGFPPELIDLVTKDYLDY